MKMWATAKAHNKHPKINTYGIDGGFLLSGSEGGVKE